MPRHFTPFEKAVVASIAWQLQGFHTKKVPENATRRIMRASLRRISPSLRGRSVALTESARAEMDHVVPVSVLVDILLEITDRTITGIEKLLTRYHSVAELTYSEHREKLKRFHSKMPLGWDYECQDVDNDLARYGAVAISLELGASEPEAPRRASTRPVGQRKARVKLPLDDFYSFARQHDMPDDAKRIKSPPIPTVKIKYSSKYRRGLVIEFLEQEGLLETFLDEHWPFGKTREGGWEMQSYRNYLR